MVNCICSLRKPKETPKEKVMNRPIDIVLTKLDMTNTELAKELKVDQSTVARWSYNTDGHIPYKYHPAILELRKGRRRVSRQDLLVV